MNSAVTSSYMEASVCERLCSLWVGVPDENGCKYRHSNASHNYSSLPLDTRENGEVNDTYQWCMDNSQAYCKIHSGMRASIYVTILLNWGRYHRVNSSRHLIIPYLRLLFVLKAHKRTVLPGRGLHRGGVEARYLVSTTSAIDIHMVMACPMV